MLLKITPIPKPRMTQRDRWAKRPSVLRYYEFCDELRLLYKGTIPERVRILFVVPMPASWSNKKREAMFLAPHQQRPDIDNLVKAVLDALCEDDSYIHHIEASKNWGEEGGIIIEEIDGSVR